MGELVLNEVKEGNKKIVFSVFTTHYSSTPTLHADGINRLAVKAS